MGTCHGMSPSCFQTWNWFGSEWDRWRRVVSWVIFWLSPVPGGALTHWGDHMRENSLSAAQNCTLCCCCCGDWLDHQRVHGSGEMSGSDSMSPAWTLWEDSSTARLEPCSFLCFRVVILIGVILALRLDSSAIKEGEFRTGHPQTLNKNAVARLMNSRCQVLHPKIYFLLWFLFKKGCAWVMSSSWWALPAQHYATEINSVYAGAPGMARRGVQPGSSPTSGASTLSLCLSDVSCVWTGMAFAAFSPKRASHDNCPFRFPFQNP